MRLRAIRNAEIIELRRSERGQHRGQFHARLGVLALRIGIGDNAASREQRGLRTAKQRRPNRDRKFTFPAMVDPSDSARIPSAIQAFVFADEFERKFPGLAADRRRRMQLFDDFQNVAPGYEAGRKRRAQMLHVGKLQNRRSIGNLQRRT